MSDSFHFIQIKDFFIQSDSHKFSVVSIYPPEHAEVVQVKHLAQG